MKDTVYRNTVSYSAPDTKVKNINIFGNADDQAVNNSLKIMFPWNSNIAQIFNFITTIRFFNIFLIFG